MPLYEYECSPCQVIYQVRHGMHETPLHTCPVCGATVRRLISAPNLNLKNFTSPTQAKYATVTATEEIAREQELQKSYRTIWLPPPVKHNPWEE